MHCRTASSAQTETCYRQLPPAMIIPTYATSVSAYINKCTEDVSVRRNIVTDEVHKILKARNSAFKST